MRLLLQRVSQARVEIAGAVVGEIGQGLLVLAGFGQADTLDLPGTKPWRALCDKVLDLRLFPDEAGKMNLSLREAQSGQGGDLLLVSQFTLYADTRRGRRPSFSSAAPPEVASQLYDRLVHDLRAAQLANCGGGSDNNTGGGFATGVFGAEMNLTFTNWGPVTILLDSADFA